MNSNVWIDRLVQKWHEIPLAHIEPEEKIESLELSCDPHAAQRARRFPL
jgi:hypothetical protein